MQRDILALLWDIDESAAAIAEYTAGLDEAAFLADRRTQDAVERRFITIGEALARLGRDWPEAAARIPELRKAVGMRNRLTHEYRTVNAETIWEASLHSIPELKRAVEALISEPDGASAPTSTGPEVK